MKLFEEPESKPSSRTLKRGGPPARTHHLDVVSRGPDVGTIAELDIDLVHARDVQDRERTWGMWSRAFISVVAKLKAKSTLTQGTSGECATFPTLSKNFVPVRQVPA